MLLPIYRKKQATNRKKGNRIEHSIRVTLDQGSVLIWASLAGLTLIPPLVIASIVVIVVK